MKSKEFDVFLSHSSVDKPWVTCLKDALQALELKVWLDQDEIRPGALFVGALEAGIEESRAVALIVSPEAMKSGWVREEYSRALTLAQEKNQQPLQLIPVILRNAELPGFLANRNWVDFRDESAFDKSLENLIWGITGEKPADASTQLRDVSETFRKAVENIPGKTQIEPRTSLEARLERNAPELWNRLIGLYKKAEGLFLCKLSPPLHVWDREEHVKTIRQLLDELMPDEVKESMLPQEIFVLLSAIYLHEIGLVAEGEAEVDELRLVRENHHYRTQQMIGGHFRELGLTAAEAQAIGYVCYGYKKDSNILKIPERKGLGDPRTEVRIRFLSALLRLSHALDFKAALAESYASDGVEVKESSFSVMINVERWEIRIEAIAQTPDEEELFRQLTETAQAELDQVDILLRLYGLQFHTIRPDIDRMVTEPSRPQFNPLTNPYKQLAPFTEQDTELFFGRDLELKVLLGKVCSYNLVTLLGESGVGKTSLLKAGLTPELQSLEYKVVYSRCYEQPETQLVKALLRDSPEGIQTDSGSFSDVLLAVNAANPLHESSRIFVEPSPADRHEIDDVGQYTD